MSGKWGNPDFAKLDAYGPLLYLCREWLIFSFSHWFQLSQIEILVFSSNCFGKSAIIKFILVTHQCWHHVGGNLIPLCSCYVLSGKYEYCQGDVMEKSGNFEEARCYEPCQRMYQFDYVIFMIDSSKWHLILPPSLIYPLIPIIYHLFIFIYKISICFNLFLFALLY